MKSTKMLLVLSLVSIIMTLFTVPVKPAEAKELQLTATENPYFGTLYQSSGKDVSFKKYDKSLLQGDSCILYLQNVDDDDMSVTFRSSDTSVLTVKKLSDSSCKVTGTGYGSAKVTARITTSSGFFLFDETETIKAKFNVTPKAVSVRFHAKQKTLAVQSTVKLAMTIRPSISKETPVFQTQNNKIASVSSKGVVTGKKVGSTYITATIQNGNTAKCKILVKKASALNGKSKK